MLVPILAGMDFLSKVLCSVWRPQLVGALHHAKELQGSLHGRHWPVPDRFIILRCPGLPSTLRRRNSRLEDPVMNGLSSQFMKIQLQARLMSITQHFMLQLHVILFAPCHP